MVRVIQLVCSDGFGGVERYIANLAGAMRADGVQVDVVGGRPTTMRQALAGTGAEWFPGSSVHEALRSLRALPRPDILNTHMSQADVLGVAYRAGRGRSTQQVSTRHFAAPRGGRALTRRLLARLDGRIAAQLSISEFVAESIGSPSTVVYSGVKPRDRATERDRVVLVAQRLEKEKDTETAVRAWRAAGARSAGWRMQIAGDGSQRPELERLAKTLGVADTIDFLGFRPDVDALLAKAHLVLAPTPREGLGMLVLEAMSHGTVVVASAGGGHLETVGAARADLLFPVGDAVAAAMLIDSLTEDREGCELAGAQLHALQRDRFSLTAQAAATKALYERVAR